MSKYTVLITSAVYSNYGMYTPQQRIQQTLETAKSARKYIPDATVILIDNSKVDVQNDDSAEFNELIDLVDYYIDNSNDVDIKHFHQSVTNYDIGKNSMECLGLYKALSHIVHDQELKKIIESSNQVFKLSGRYVITDNFDLSKFDNADTKGKFVFKKRQPSWIPEADTGVNHLLQTRLWSFPTEDNGIVNVLNIFQQIINNMFATFNQGKYIDVEHSMAKFIPKDQLVELDTVGLQGNIAPNGMMIID